ncbi:MAG TPA: phosphoenolpyruvate--protein phosphotransferase [Burkholderiales bacterium]|nr:phosphoenolpyruvate--protein phosphotransferase [Burkholderiales bacterium]
MLALYGTGVSEGISIGSAFVLSRELPDVAPQTVAPEEIEREVERFVQAVQAARDQLLKIRGQIPSDAPIEAASFIDTHTLILEDKMISEAPIELIRTQRQNAEWALKIQSDQLTEIFERMEDPYLRNKKTDVKHVVDRVMRQLLARGVEEDEILDPGEIVVATDLTPADTVVLKNKEINAFVTTLGGPISHTAILARSLGIPAIVGMHNATLYIRGGEQIIVDGKRGVLIIAPDDRTIAEYQSRQRDVLRRREALTRLRKSRAVTRDGKAVTLQANIELPADIDAAIGARAAGIGLYRTEFLFMNRAAPPSEEEQFRAYAHVARALAGKPVTIRTIDIGADKQVDGAGIRPTVNPALGLRAVRLCLHDPAFFRPQLRAILRASAFGRVRLMIPMLSSQDELFRVIDLIDETKSSLKRAGEKYNPRLPIGGMVEIPAAAVSADLFAPYLDFFSIGTNDLIQYTLAIDRTDDTVSYLYDPLHPAVLRLISLTIEAAKRARIPVAMCGEMAGDARYTRLLLGMGLREFSMHPATLLMVKRNVLSSDVAKLTRYARRVLSSTDTQAVHEMVDSLNDDDLI